MQHGTLGAVAASIVVLSGGIASVQEVSQSSLSRTLSVEQTAIYNVKPTPQPGGLNVVTWVDRPDYAYAEGEDVKFFVQDQQGRVRHHPERRSGWSDHDSVPQPVPAHQLGSGRPRARGARLRLAVADRRVRHHGHRTHQGDRVAEPIDPFEARQLAAAGPYQMVRARAQGVARSLTVTMLGEEPDPAGADFPVYQAGEIGGVGGVPSDALDHSGPVGLAAAHPQLGRHADVRERRIGHLRGVGEVRGGAAAMVLIVVGGVGSDAVAQSPRAPVHRRAGDSGIDRPVAGRSAGHVPATATRRRRSVSCCASASTSTRRS